MAAYVNMDIEHEPSRNRNAQQLQNTRVHNVQSGPRSDQHRVFRLVGVTIGLVCILQGTLNIVLRIYLNSRLEKDLVQVGCNNRTKEQEQKMKLLKENDQLHRTIARLVGTVDKPGWIYFSSSLYYVSPEVARWVAAKEDCRARGANLVIVNSKEEQAFVEMLRFGQPAWIGLSDQAAEGHWKWEDGSDLTLWFWASQEPNNYLENENCVITGFETHDERPITDHLDTWNDFNCRSKFIWICEQPVSLKFV